MILVYSSVSGLNPNIHNPVCNPYPGWPHYIIYYIIKANPDLKTILDNRRLNHRAEYKISTFLVAKFLFNKIKIYEIDKNHVIFI